ncbi:hypothetical protein MICAF_2010001 [Microcystis aeruginosa PCC 9807]|uniref:Uncharacterized protein n=1 Tax=Microcystis aeruginosa PCC 9807 TaxID=1160283 RepID=I4H394_MICAE|nr:hypothetical protein MICAF_2010001 [Microcystis aeruginosa PCC 9807]
MTFDGTIRLESQDRLSKGSYMVPTSDQANDFIQKNALSSGVTNAVIGNFGSETPPFYGGFAVKS